MSFCSHAFNLPAPLCSVNAPLEIASRSRFLEAESAPLFPRTLKMAISDALALPCPAWAVRPSCLLGRLVIGPVDSQCPCDPAELAGGLRGLGGLVLWGFPGGRSSLPSAGKRQSYIFSRFLSLQSAWHLLSPGPEPPSHLSREPPSSGGAPCSDLGLCCSELPPASVGVCSPTPEPLQVLFPGPTAVGRDSALQGQAPPLVPLLSWTRLLGLPFPGPQVLGV